MTAYAPRLHHAAIAALLALVCSSPAVAQTQLYLLTASSNSPWDYGDPEHPARIIQIDVDGHRIVASTSTGDVRGFGIGVDPHVTPDGRFLLWSGGELCCPIRVNLFDIAHQQQSILVDAFLQSDFVPLAVHPSEMRAFLQLSPFGPVTVVEPAHTRTLPVPPCAKPVFSTRSGDGRRLSYRCLDPLRVILVDSGDGRLIGSVPYANAHRLDDEGTTVFGVDWQSGVADTTKFRRYDVATGAVLAERAAPDGFDGWLFDYNRATGHLYVGVRSGIHVLDASTLQDVGRIASPHPSLYATMALDPDRPDAYIAWSGLIDGRAVVRVSLLDTVTLATVGSLDIPTTGEVLGMALGPRPPRVSDLSALVTGRLVTLSWTIDTSRSIATEQVVEVGLFLGQTLVRLPVATTASSLAVAGAPPGRYYVRIRSVNGTGVGAASNEVLIEVP